MNFRLVKMKWYMFPCSKSPGALRSYLVSSEHLLDLGSYLAQSLVLIESQKFSGQKLYEDSTHDMFSQRKIRRLKHLFLINSQHFSPSTHKMWKLAEFLNFLCLSFLENWACLVGFLGRLDTIAKVFMHP